MRTRAPCLSLCLIAAAACSHAHSAAPLAPVELPDSVTFLPPPPAPGSAAFTRDEAAAAEARRASPERWARAIADANLSLPEAYHAYDCALGVETSETATPRLYQLLKRVMTTAGLATRGAKAHYQRTRPFAYYGIDLCTPGERAALAADGSYPSGHSAFGWAWALVLAELDPTRGDAILARGRDFCQSRVICNAHWQSDVDEGRTVAAAAVARLHADPTFREELDTVREELSHLTAAGRTPARCP